MGKLFDKQKKFYIFQSYAIVVVVVGITVAVVFPTYIFTIPDFFEESSFACTTLYFNLLSQSCGFYCVAKIANENWCNRQTNSNYNNSTHIHKEKQKTRREHSRNSIALTNSDLHLFRTERSN